jgi:hypothetical protein
MLVFQHPADMARAEERRRFTFNETRRLIMKKNKQIKLDCSKNCKSVVQACEAEGRSRDECENRHNQCVSNCTFA